MVTSLALLTAAFGVLALAGCSDSSDGAPVVVADAGPDAAVVVDAGPDAAVVVDAASPTLAIAPTDSKVLTCSTLGFTETGGAGGGAWTVTPAAGSGTIAPAGATASTYSAPTTLPTAHDVTIGYAEGPKSATASVHLATAFLGAAAQLPVGTNALASEGNSPFEHAFTANGSRVYAGVAGPAADSGGYANTIQLYASNDSGHTFAAPVSYHTGTLECATAAVDAANPDVVYFVYYASHGDSPNNTGATVRLAVSEDGGKTFPAEYVVADTDSTLAEFICPDVVSPSADHVIVTGVLVDGTNAWAGTFISANRGKNIGPLGVPGTLTSADPANLDSSYSATDTNSGSKIACGINSDGGNFGPRVFSNGQGAACVTYDWTSGDGCPSTGSLVVQCSKDNGATWTAPKAAATPASKAKQFLTGAISPSGKIALVYLETVDTHDEVKVIISKDGGLTFGAPSVYPSAPRVANGSGYTADPVVAWENDQVLWLTQTFDQSDSPTLSVDKTCDDGATWSGAVTVGKFLGSSLLHTAGGMLATGYTPSGPIVSVPLAQLTP